MRRRDLLQGLGALLMAGPAAAEVRTADAFLIGIAPHTSVRAILEQYGPLRRWLEQAHGGLVEIQTARDFSIFAERALQQAYDLAITTGHQARLLQTDAGYLPLVTYRADFKAIVVAAKDGGVMGPGDIGGRPVIGLGETSLVTQWGVSWLKANHVAPSLKFISAADSVADLLASDQAAIGFISTANFEALSESVRERLVILDQSQTMLGRVYLLNRRHEAMVEQITASLYAFADSAIGMQYFAATQLGGFRAVNPSELDYMEPFANDVRRALKNKSP